MINFDKLKNFSPDKYSEWYVMAFLGCFSMVCVVMMKYHYTLLRDGVAQSASVVALPKSAGPKIERQSYILPSVYPDTVRYNAPLGMFDSRQR